MERIRKDFTTLTLVLIAVGVAINIAIGQLVILLKLPVYLDSIGTILVGVLAGPWAGALTGFLANMIWGLSGLNPTYAPFALVGMVIGLVAGLFAEAGWMRVWWRAVLAGFITGILSSLVSAPIAHYVFGGVTGAATDVLVAFFQGLGYDPLNSNFMQGLVSDPVDKLASFFVVFLIVLALPKRFLGRFPRAENVIGEQPVVLGMSGDRGVTTPVSMPQSQMAEPPTAKSGSTSLPTEPVVQAPVKKTGAGKKPTAKTPTKRPGKASTPTKPAAKPKTSAKKTSK